MTCAAGLGYNELQHGGHCQDTDKANTHRVEGPCASNLGFELKETQFSGLSMAYAFLRHWLHMHKNDEATAQARPKPSFFASSIASP